MQIEDAKEITKGAMADKILRAGVAFAFLYPAIDAFLNPYTWFGYFPPFLQGILPDMILLHGFGALEIILGLWILFGKHIYWGAVFASVILAGIIVFNFNNFEVLFRDVSILAMTVALAILHKPNNWRNSE